MRNLLSVQELSLQEIIAIFNRTSDLKKNPFKPVLRNKNLAMIFQKPSTRTRVSFEIAMNQLGGKALYLNYQDMQLGRGETIADTARALSRFADGIVARVFSHNDLVELAENSSIPVINGLSDLLHPCQTLADMYTLHERFGQLRGLNLAYLGNARNNVTHSLLHTCSRLGVNMTVACPRKLGPSKAILKESRANSRTSGARIEVISDPVKAVKNADIIYTDTWFSMGEKPTASRKRSLRKFQVNNSLMSKAKKQAVVMHNLPAHRGQEITDSVIDGRQSIVWDQAENRLHVQKGILSLLL
jgi:ornithine carbamoyltransferase